MGLRIMNHPYWTNTDFMSYFGLNFIYICRQRLFHNGLLDVYQWIWELRDRLAKEKYINRSEGGKKRKIPCEELISRIHGL